MIVSVVMLEFLFAALSSLSVDRCDSCCCTEIQIDCNWNWNDFKQHAQLGIPDSSSLRLMNIEFGISRLSHSFSCWSFSLIIDCCNVTPLMKLKTQSLEHNFLWLDL